MTILNISFEEGLFAISEIIQDAPSASFRFEEVAVQHRGGARFHLRCLLSETRIIGETGSEDATTFLNIRDSTCFRCSDRNVRGATMDML